MDLRRPTQPRSKRVKDGDNATWAAGPWRYTGARLLILLAAITCCSTPCLGQTSRQSVVINREYAIKAAFLYHFLTYTEWPSDPEGDKKADLVIGVYGDDPFGAVLDKIAMTKKVGERRIAIRRVTKQAEIVGCHLLFVSGSVPVDTQKQLIRATVNRPILCVGEADWFVEGGGASQFFLEGNKVRFAFNTDEVRERNLKVSSKLLALAKIVSNAQSSR